MKKIFLFLLLTFLISACSSDDSTDFIPETPEAENLVKLRTDATFGSVLTDSEGFTLYFFAPDSKGDANCLGNCSNAWPTFFEASLTIDDGLDLNDFATITRSDGAQQTTYKGWPLYRFSNDASAGQVNGDGSGGVWFVAKPDYSLMLVRAQLIGRNVDGVETNLNSAFESGDEDRIYLVDDRGNTLYSFINDTAGKNNFTADDFSNNSVWPIFNVDVQNIPSTLNMADFESIVVFGRAQITYKGWPLYTFGQDENRGDNFGVGFPQAGVWPTKNNDTDPAPEEETNVKEFNVTNQGASAYIFNGEGLENVSNPDITLKRGETYEFNIESPGHPFIIKSVQSTGTGNGFNTGVTNNGVASGKVIFVVPSDAPDTLFYNCEFHGSMTGTFNIVD